MVSAIPCPRCDALIDVDEEGCRQCGGSRRIAGTVHLQSVLFAAPTIFRARDLRRDELVDVEVATLVSRTAWSGFDRFERTARALSSQPLPPSLPRVHTLVRDEGGRVFMVREALTGGSLFARVRAEETNLSGEAVFALLRGLLEAVATLHALTPPVCHGAIDADHVAFREPSAIVPVLVAFDAACDDFVEPTVADDLLAIATTVTSAAREIPASLRALLDDLTRGRLKKASIALDRLTTIERASSPARRARRLQLGAASIALGLGLFTTALVVHARGRVPVTFAGEKTSPSFAGTGVGSECLLETSPPGAQVFALDGRTISDEEPPAEARIGATPLRVGRPAVGARALLVTNAGHRSAVITVAAGSSEGCSLRLSLTPR